MKSLALEHTETGTYRVLVFETFSNGQTAVADIAESESLGELNFYIVEEHPDITAVRINGVNDVPDCLTPFEAAEAAMVPRS